MDRCSVCHVYPISHGASIISTLFIVNMFIWGVELDNLMDIVHSLSSGKGKIFLCAACHAFTPRVNPWENLIGIVVQVQARG